MDSNASAAAESLATHLRTVRFAGESSRQVTSTLTSVVSSWGKQQGLRVVREVPAPPETRIDRHGFLDVVCFDGDTPAVAVEIDRGNKQWSQRKLETVAAYGVTALWLRWGSRSLRTDRAEGVDLIRLPMCRQRSKDADSGWRSCSSQSL